MKKKKKTITTVVTVSLFETEKKKKMSHQSTVTATVLVQCKYTECTVPNRCSGLAAFIYKDKELYIGKVSLFYRRGGIVHRFSF